MVKGDGDMAWGKALADCREGFPSPIYAGGQIEASDFVAARWDLVPRNRYMWASVQTVRGCPKHCSFCSVWRTDGQRPRQRASDVVIEEIVQLRRLGFRFIALADDNFYPVTLTDLSLAAKQKNTARLNELKSIRAERFELMARLAKLPDRHGLLYSDHNGSGGRRGISRCHESRAHQGRARRRGIGDPARVERRLQGFQPGGRKSHRTAANLPAAWRARAGSFIFGLPSDRPETFAATAAAAISAECTFAQFVILSPYPGTVDFIRWEKTLGDNPPTIAGIPLTRRWLIPQALRPKLYWDHPVMSARGDPFPNPGCLGQFLQLGPDLEAFAIIKSSRGRLAFVLISRIYRLMYADTGIATDSARVTWSGRWTRWMAKPCRHTLRRPAHAGSEIPGSQPREGSPSLVPLSS